jgi:iron-sulfur cluster assembly protein
MIHLTETAIAEVKRMMTEQRPAATVLRIGVSAGGCSGLQYSMDFATTPQQNDQVFEQDGLQVVCDREALPYLSGLTVDFHRALVGGGFKFVNPNASKSCGCGTSFRI